MHFFRGTYLNHDYCNNSRLSLTTFDFVSPRILWVKNIIQTKEFPLTLIYIRSLCSTENLFYEKVAPDTGQNVRTCWEHTHLNFSYNVLFSFVYVFSRELKAYGGHLAEEVSNFLFIVRSEMPLKHVLHQSQFFQYVREIVKQKSFLCTK